MVADIICDGSNKAVNKTICVDIVSEGEGFIVVSCRRQSQNLGGILLEQKKSSGVPCGITAPPWFSQGAACSEDDPSRADPFHTISTRMTYFQPSSTAAKGARGAGHGASGRRLRPRQVLCVQCRNVCTEGMQSVGKLPASSRATTSRPPVSSVGSENRDPLAGRFGNNLSLAAAASAAHVKTLSVPVVRLRPCQMSEASNYNDLLRRSSSTDQPQSPRLSATISHSQTSCCSSPALSSSSCCNFTRRLSTGRTSPVVSPIRIVGHRSSDCQRASSRRSPSSRANYTANLLQPSSDSLSSVGDTSSGQNVDSVKASCLSRPGLPNGSIHTSTTQQSTTHVDVSASNVGAVVLDDDSSVASVAQVDAPLQPPLAKIRIRRGVIVGTVWSRDTEQHVAAPSLHKRRRLSHCSDHSDLAHPCDVTPHGPAHHHDDDGGDEDSMTNSSSPRTAALKISLARDSVLNTSARHKHKPNSSVVERCTRQGVTLQRENTAPQAVVSSQNHERRRTSTKKRAVSSAAEPMDNSCNDDTGLGVDLNMSSSCSPSSSVSHDGSSDGGTFSTGDVVWAENSDNIWWPAKIVDARYETAGGDTPLARASQCYSVTWYCCHGTSSLTAARVRPFTHVLRVLLPCIFVPLNFHQNHVTHNYRALAITCILLRQTRADRRRRGLLHEAVRLAELETQCVTNASSGNSG